MSALPIPVPIAGIGIIGYLVIVIGIPLLISIAYCLTRWSRGKGKCR